MYERGTAKGFFTRIAKKRKCNGFQNVVGRSRRIFNIVKYDIPLKYKSRMKAFKFKAHSCDCQEFNTFYMCETEQYLSRVDRDNCYTE